MKSVLLNGEASSTATHRSAGLRSDPLKQYDREVSLVAFDLLELDGDDVRNRPLLERKAQLAKLVAKVRDGIAFSEPMRRPGLTGCSS